VSEEEQKALCSGLRRNGTVDFEDRKRNIQVTDLQSKSVLSMTRDDIICAECGVPSALLAQNPRPLLNRRDKSLAYELQRVQGKSARSACGPTACVVCVLLDAGLGTQRTQV